MEKIFLMKVAPALWGQNGRKGTQVEVRRISWGLVDIRVGCRGMWMDFSLKTVSPKGESYLQESLG